MVRTASLPWTVEKTLFTQERVVFFYEKLAKRIIRSLCSSLSPICYAPDTSSLFWIFSSRSRKTRRRHQPRWDEIAERRLLVLVAAPTFPTCVKWLSKICGKYSFTFVYRTKLTESFSKLWPSQPSAIHEGREGGATFHGICLARSLPVRIRAFICFSYYYKILQTCGAFLRDEFYGHSMLTVHDNNNH